MAKAKSNAMGTNPLSGVAPGATEMIPTAAQAPPPGSGATAKKTPRLTKERMNIYLPPELADYARDAVYATGRRYTMGDLIAEFLPAAIADLEKRFNDGQPFPPRPEEAENLPTGPARLNPRRRRVA